MGHHDLLAEYHCLNTIVGVSCAFLRLILLCCYSKEAWRDYCRRIEPGVYIKCNLMFTLA